MPAPEVALSKRDRRMSKSGKADTAERKIPGSIEDAQENALSREHGFSRGLANAGLSIFWQDLDLRVKWARNVPAWWPTPSPGDQDADYLPFSEVARLMAAKHKVLSGGGIERLELRVASSEAMHWYNAWIEADKHPDGSPQGLITTFLEVTHERRREQTVAALLREVSHRSKNLLAIIQSIASQTGRYAGTVDEFLSRFRGRLQSLASSQDLVTSSNWRGADLRELVQGQVARYSADPTRNVRFEGENPYLNPNATLHIGLALHELAVNSMRFGALSAPDGIVNVSARRDRGAGGALKFQWTEKLKPGAHQPGEKRFGSLALERVVPTSLGGAASLAIESDRLDYSLTIPEGSFDLDR